MSEKISKEKLEYLKEKHKILLREIDNALQRIEGSAEGIDARSLLEEPLERDVRQSREVYFWLRGLLERQYNPEKADRESLEKVERGLWAIEMVKNLLEGRLHPTAPDDYHQIAQAIQELTEGKLKLFGSLLFLPFIRNPREAPDFHDLDMYMKVTRGSEPLMHIILNLSRLLKKRGLELQLTPFFDESDLAEPTNVFTLDSVVWPIINSPVYMRDNSSVRRFGRLKLLLDDLKRIRKKDEKLYKLNVDEIAYRTFRAYIHSLGQKLFQDAKYKYLHSFLEPRSGLDQYLDQLPHLRQFLLGWRGRLFELLKDKHEIIQDLLADDRLRVILDIRKTIHDYLKEPEAEEILSRYLKRAGFSEKNAKALSKEILERIRREHEKVISSLERLRKNFTIPQRGTS